MESKCIRKGFVYSEDSIPVMVDIYSRDEMLKKLEGNTEYKVDFQAPNYYDLRSLEKDENAKYFYYFNPFERNVISVYLDWDDTYYEKSLKGVTLASALLVEKCKLELKECGVSDEDFILFRRYKDTFILEVGADVCVSIDSLAFIYRETIYSILNDTDIDAEVIVFPSKGDDFFFDDAVAVYKSFKDFEEAYYGRTDVKYK